jgi:peptidoglycan/LPS O-acetylase OafA/YrhL
MLLEQWNHSLPVTAQTLIRGGYLAVQTFFLLSGFVLAQSYLNTRWNRDSLKRFAIARFARIYPAYLLSLALVLWFMLQFVMNAGHTAIEKAAVLGQYTFVLQGWAAPSVGWNTPAWSLSCEFFFYACFPFLAVFIGRGGAIRLWTALALSLTAPIALTHWGVPAAWKPLHHLADFAAGIVAARLYRLIEDKTSAKWTGFGLSLFALTGGMYFIAYPRTLDGTIGNLNTALRPLNMVLLIGLGAGGGFLGRLLSTPAMEYLGKASYSMYILHIPLLWWYTAYTSFRWGAAPPAWVGFLYIASAIGVSIAAYELVEMPANRWIRDFRVRPARETQSRELPAATESLSYAAVD